MGTCGYPGDGKCKPVGIPGMGNGNLWVSRGWEMETCGYSGDGKWLDLFLETFNGFRLLKGFTTIGEIIRQKRSFWIFKSKVFGSFLP